MFVIARAQDHVNDHTKITQPHKLFLNLPAKDKDTPKHELKFLGCGWVEAYDFVLLYCTTESESRQIPVGRDEQGQTIQGSVHEIFNDFKRIAEIQGKISDNKTLDLQRYEALTLLLRGNYKNDTLSDAPAKFDGLNDIRFDQLRLQCLHLLWDSLAKCNILSLYIDSHSEKRLDDMTTDIVMRNRCKYIITAFQNNNLPSMLHCSLEKRLVDMQVEKFKRFHKAYYKHTTYASAGLANPERQALLTTQRLFYVNMIFFKIELAKWCLNEMWGSDSLQQAAQLAKVDASTKKELNGLSIEMLRCATSWLIFARHYSAEMKRIDEKPDPNKRPLNKPGKKMKNEHDEKQRTRNAKKPRHTKHDAHKNQHLIPAAKPATQHHSTPKYENLYEILLKMSGKQYYKKKKPRLELKPDDLISKANEPSNNQKRIDATFIIFHDAQKLSQVLEKERSDRIKQYQTEKKQLVEVYGVPEATIEQKKILQAKIDSELDESSEAQINLSLVKDILLTYKAVRDKYDENLTKRNDNDTSRQELETMVQDYDHRRNAQMQMRPTQQTNNVEDLHLQETQQEKTEQKTVNQEESQAERKAEKKAEAKKKAEEQAEAKKKAEEKAQAERKAEKKAQANREAEEKAQAERKAEEQAQIETEKTVLSHIDQEIEKLLHKVIAFKQEIALEDNDDKPVEFLIRELQRAARKQNTYRTLNLMNFIMYYNMERLQAVVQNESKKEQAKNIELDIEVFVEYLKKVIVRCQTTKELWKQSSEDFVRRWQDFKDFYDVDNQVNSFTQQLLGNFNEAPYYGDIREFLKLNERGQEVNMSVAPDPDALLPPERDFLAFSNPYFVKK